MILEKFSFCCIITVEGDVRSMKLNVEIEGVLLGAIITIVADMVWHYIEGMNRKKHSARLLYYDILSIRKYVDQYNQNPLDPYADLRYNGEWQKMLLELDFLSSEQIESVYDLYDAVYNFDYSDERSWQESCFGKINKIFQSQEFDALMNEILCKAKIKRG